ncbi:hypothetical protein, partial [Puniceibacterium confluentis]
AYPFAARYRNRTRVKDAEMGISVRQSLAVLFVAGLGLSACSTENIADNTVDATVFATKTVVKGAVGAGKLAYKGTAAAVNAARDSTATKDSFPAGTPVCTNANGGYYEALQNNDGVYYCLAMKK